MNEVLLQYNPKYTINIIHICDATLMYVDTYTHTDTDIDVGAGRQISYGEGFQAVAVDHHQEVAQSPTP